MRIKSLSIIPLCLLLFLFHLQAQSVPNGKWQNDDLIDNTRGYKVDFQEDVIIVTRTMPFWEKANIPKEEINLEDNKDTTLIDYYRVLRTINKKGDESKGIIYLKNREERELPIMVIIFNQIEEDILFLQPMREFVNLGEAEEAIAFAQQDIREAIENPQGMNPTIAKNADIYTFGYMIMFRTEKSLTKIKEMPMMTLESKEKVLEFLSHFQEQLGNIEIPNEVQGPFASQLVVEKILIDMGYNPYTSLENINKTMQEYEEEEDVKELNKGIKSIFAERFGYK